MKTVKLKAVKLNTVMNILNTRCICFFSVATLLFVSLFACAKQSGGKQHDSTFQYASFRDVPGVTEDEIKAIEELQRQGASLVFSTPPSTEAFLDKEGELGGFAVLFCGWMTSLFGIRFETERYALGDILAKLKTGEVDLSILTLTEERQKAYYMTAPIVHRSTEIMRIKGSPSPDEIVLTRPVRYVFMQGTTLIASVTAVLAPGTYEVAVARNNETAYQMLERGEADVFIGINTDEANFDPYGSIVTEVFLPLIVNPVSLTAQDPALKPVISVVTKALDAGAYRHLTELYRKGYQDYKKNKFLSQLSDEEKTYIQNNPVIPFAAQFMSYPISFYSVNEKKWEGVIFDILDEMNKLIGFEFKLVNDETTDLPELMNLLEAGTAYTIPNLIQSDERRKRFIWPDTMYQLDRFALLSKRSYPNVELNDIPFERVGFAKGSAFADLFRNWFPDALYAVEYPGTDDAFMALERGEIDLVMSSQSRLTALTNYYEFSDYKANYLFNVAFEASFGLNKDQTVLCSIIGKALPLIDTKRIVEQWMSRTYNIETMRLRGQRPWLFGSIALILCVLALLAVLFARSRRAGRGLEKLVEKRTRELEMQTAVITTLFDSIPDLIFTKDLDFRFLQCNKSFLEHFNSRKENTIGKRDFEAFGLSTETAKGFREWDRRVISEGRVVAFEETIPRFDGTEPLYETIKMPLVVNGVVIGLLGVSRDITKRKEIEDELALKTTMLTTLFDSIPAFIFAKDLNSCYLQCNKSYLAHLGFKREDVIGRNDIDGFRLNPKLVQSYWEWDRKVINERRKFVFEERIPGVNGANPLYETVKVPLVLDEKVIGVLGISHDITTRKEMEEAALSASRLKSAFLANMSHEIRTPLNAILGISENRLQDDTLDPAVKEAFGRIFNSGSLLLGIINDILDLSKIEAGRLELAESEYDTASLISDTVFLNMIKYENKPIEFILNVDEHIPVTLFGDELRIKQVMNNLLSNAFKYTDFGEVELSVFVENLSQEPGDFITLVLRVHDTGQGMTKEQLEKLGSEYSRFNLEANQTAEGTGLGMSITRNLISLMTGELFAESKPGKGSTFTVRLPQGTVGAPALGKETVKRLRQFRSTYEAQTKKAKFKRSVIAPGRVLLVDDMDMNLGVVKEMLVPYGLQVDTAINGFEAIKKIKANTYSLVFMDHMMPKMDGIEAVKKIRELGEKYEELPIVALTANAVSGMKEMFMANKFNGFVSKPVSMKELDKVLREWLPPETPAAEEKAPAEQG